MNKDGTYEGAIYPEDFLAVRRQMEERKGAAPADAGSLVRTGAPVLDAGTHLTDALKLFEQTHLPAFPVVWKETWACKTERNKGCILHFCKNLLFPVRNIIKINCWDVIHIPRTVFLPGCMAVEEKVVGMAGACG